MLYIVYLFTHFSSFSLRYSVIHTPTMLQIHRCTYNEAEAKLDTKAIGYHQPKLLSHRTIAR